MKIAICDDEKSEFPYLFELLMQYQLNRKTEFHISTFQNGTELLRSIKTKEYDLILLDVIMPGFGGIIVARELRELGKNVKIIFLTSSPDFAIESYSVGAYNYLLKPATAERLFPLLDKARAELTDEDMQGLLLRDRNNVIRIPFEKLEYVEVMNKTLSFHLTDGTVREITASLSDFESELLARPEFLKIHRAFLANMNFIKEINIKDALTNSGKSIPVSRTQYNQVKDIYLSFIFENRANRPVPEPLSKKKETIAQYCSWQILMIDDEPDDLKIWIDILHAHGCITKTASNSTAALHLATSDTWDCVILDVMMPGEDSFGICKQLADLTNAPIIFLSSIDDTDSQLQGYSSGGVDYITKDTPAALFWTKVETRIKLSTSHRAQLRFDNLVFDLAIRKVFIDDKELELTPVEFDLLLLLSEHAGNSYSPKEIFDTIWGNMAWDDGQTVQVHMSRLRRKLEKASPTHHFIETVWGQGYRFVP